MSGSAWYGRMYQYVYFASMHAIVASGQCEVQPLEDIHGTLVVQVIAQDHRDGDLIPVRAVRANRIGSFQKFRIASCSGGRVSEKVRTRWSAARNTGDPNGGGGPGLNSLPDVISIGRTNGHCGVTHEAPGRSPESRTDRNDGTTTASDPIRLCRIDHVLACRAPACDCRVEVRRVRSGRSQVGEHPLEFGLIGWKEIGQNRHRGAAKGPGPEATPLSVPSPPSASSA